MKQKKKMKTFFGIILALQESLQSGLFWFGFFVKNYKIVIRFYTSRAVDWKKWRTEYLYF